jgi:hypothetical protein
MAWRSSMKFERGVLCEQGAAKKKLVFSLTTHVQGVASQVFDFSRNSSWASVLNPKNCPKISISCRQPLNVGYSIQGKDFPNTKVKQPGPSRLAGCRARVFLPVYE